VEKYGGGRWNQTSLETLREENSNTAGFLRIRMSYPSKAPLSQYFLGGEECFDHYPSAEKKTITSHGGERMKGI